MYSDVILYKGYWWIPSLPDDQVAGTLTIDSRGDMQLELYGGFCLEEKGIQFEREEDAVIYGRCYAPNGHMKDVSLFECHSAINLNFSSNFPITRYTCYYALIGYHTLSMNDASFFEARVEFPELAYWCPPKNITTFIKESSITIELNTSRENCTLASIKLGNGIILNLNQACSYKPDYPQVYIDQATTLEIQKEGISGFGVLSTTRSFERFLSLGMLRPIEHGRITLRARDCYQETEKGNKYFHSIEMVTHLYIEGNKSAVKMPEMLFKHADIEEQFESMYQKYSTEKNIAQIWSNLIDSIEKKRVFTSNDFLVVIQALDGFSKRFRKEQDFLPQLTALRDEFKDIRRVNITDCDLKCAIGSRDYYSHILKVEKKKKRHALEGEELYNLTRKLRVLLICCVLDFLGLDKNKINELLNNCNHSILRVG
jgi:hypothetical protein